MTIWYLVCSILTHWGLDIYVYIKNLGQLWFKQVLCPFQEATSVPLVIYCGLKPLEQAPDSHSWNDLNNVIFRIVIICLCFNKKLRLINTYIDRLVQERSNSSLFELELHLSCTNPSIYKCISEPDHICKHQAWTSNDIILMGTLEISIHKHAFAMVTCKLSPTFSPHYVKFHVLTTIIAMLWPLLRKVIIWKLLMRCYLYLILSWFYLTINSFNSLKMEYQI